MKKVMEFRAQARLCRQLAIREPKNRIYWLAEAERWSRLTQDEISATTKNATSLSCVMQLPARMLWLEQSDLPQSKPQT